MISAEFFLPLRLLGSFFHIAMNGNAAADKDFPVFGHAGTRAWNCTENAGAMRSAFPM